MPPEFGVKMTQEEFDEFGDFVFYFTYDQRGDGETFSAGIKEGNKEIQIGIKHENIDAYIYALQDIKQNLELLRIKT